MISFFTGLMMVMNRFSKASGKFKRPCVYSENCGMQIALSESLKNA